MTRQANLEHLTPTERQALQEFVQLLREQFDGQIRSALLFGSKARGEGTPDSDLDVLVVVDNEDWRVHKQVRYLAADICFKHGLNLSPRVWSVAHRRELEELQTRLYQNIDRDGINLLGPSAAAADELVSRLRQALASLLEQQPISLAYLYGSAASGQVTPFSDVDIGLVAVEPLTPLERLKLILGLQVDLADCCDVPNADVRILNDAPLILRGKVVSDGILLYARDERERVEFEATTRMECFDYLPVHKRFQETFLASIRERGLYG